MKKESMQAIETYVEERTRARGETPMAEGEGNGSPGRLV